MRRKMACFLRIFVTSFFPEQKLKIQGLNILNFCWLFWPLAGREKVFSFKNTSNWRQQQSLFLYSVPEQNVLLSVRVYNFEHYSFFYISYCHFQITVHKVGVKQAKRENQLGCKIVTNSWDFFRSLSSTSAWCQEGNK